MEALTLAELISDAQILGGITARSVTGGWAPQIDIDGYYVSTPDGIERVPEEQLFTEVLYFVKNNVSKLAVNKVLLGLWRDEDGLWSIDSSVRFQTREFAELAGRLGNQRAIFDIKNNAVINLI